ncbi:MAG: sigma 54-interacting transcriptional regulator, partial [Candidatus Eisenbacteria bacterium]|nr:sigma 54-interacting transcriptional regulator [Candidatus Eisenbacteria bacterium]
RRGALAEANSLYARASQLYWQSGNLSGHAVVLLNRAWAVGLIGLLPQSAALFEEAGQQAHSLGRATTELLARLGLGWVAVRGGDLAQARARLLGAWREARRRRLPREETLALAYLAEAYALRGETARADRALRRAEGIAERLAPEGDLALEVRIRGAMVALARGDLEGSRAEARRALALARRAGMRWEEAQALRLEGMASAQRGHRREARRVLQRALILLESMGEQLERRVVLAWLAAVRPLGEPERASTGAGLWGGSDAALRFWLGHPLLGPPSTGRLAADPRAAGGGGSAAVAGDRAGARLRAGEPFAAEVTPPAPVWAELGLVTRSPALIAVLRQVEVFATSELPILILGETGTGKDLVAQAVHALSGLSGRHVPVNCAATRKDLFVAELFGARKGAYTGADRDRSGLIEEARGGTLFLDEVADLEAEAQGFLLRFLDSGEIRALGDAQTRRVKARVVAATCVDLAERVAEGRFRPDLYGRLAGLVVHLPPLRERSEDLGPIASALWRREGGESADCARVFTPGVLALLAGCRWPGNVRELRHAVGRAMLYTRTHGADAARASLEDWAARMRASAAQGEPRGAQD